MNTSAPGRWFPFLRLALVASVAFGAAGCLSSKYRAAPKTTPPAVAMNLGVVQRPLAVGVDTVIVQKGPGSWKQEAFWDEYVCTLTNRGAGPLTVEAAVLIDALDAAQAPGDDPWKLEKLSRENIRKFEHVGRKLVLGAGVTLGWMATPGLAYSAAVSGASPALAVYAGLAVLVAVPAWAIGTGVRTLVARGAMRDEFDRRRLRLPLVLAAGETRRGSVFFPIAPGPQRLEWRFAAGASGQTATIGLAPLAGLHLLRQLPEAQP